MRTRIAAITLVLGVLAAVPALAGHHRWDFTEAFSSPDGSVQFVELIGTADNEQFLNGFSVTTGTNTFIFTSNCPSNLTNGKWVLLATSGFGSIPGGATPDYVIPSNFFALTAGTFNYASGADIWNHGTIPNDGINSLKRDGSTSANSPRNFAGNGTSVDLSVSTPGFPKWGLVLLVGAMLLTATTLLRRREASIA